VKVATFWQAERPNDSASEAAAAIASRGRVNRPAFSIHRLGFVLMARMFESGTGLTLIVQGTLEKSL
jgi:hypothetical protein